MYGLQDYVTADPDTTPPDVAATPDSTPVRSCAGGDEATSVPCWSSGTRAPVTVRFTATDDKAGVSRVQYSLTGGVGWKTGASAVTKNGITTVLYRGLDRVRNASDVSGKTVGVDTVRPKPSAPYAGRREARTARRRIRYKVADIKAMTV